MRPSFLFGVSGDDTGDKTMGQYGEAAVRAVRFLHDLASSISTEDKWKEAIEDAWKEALKNKKPSIREKNCPKRTFIALCESGIVVDVPPGKYNKRPTTEQIRQENLTAINRLVVEPDLAKYPRSLWEKTGHTEKHNDEMDVITALWLNDLIDKVA